MAFLQHKLPRFPTASTCPPPPAPWTLVSLAPSHVAPEYPGPQACSSPPRPTTTPPCSSLPHPSLPGPSSRRPAACGQPQGPAAQPSDPRVHQPCLFSLQLPSPRGLALVLPIVPQPHQPQRATPGTITPTSLTRSQIHFLKRSSKGMLSPHSTTFNSYPSAPKKAQDAQPGCWVMPSGAPTLTRLPAPAAHVLHQCSNRTGSAIS